ncbi:MAG TPA: PilC/PilY family type IV pilus protein [Luteimonas sp.]|nr:PilC/PilY family type IV pilus protein [Luteimonas sp.]
MTKTVPNFAKQSSRKRGNRALPAFVACLSTLLALPVNAVTFPDNPVQTGAAYPPPNVMFILDDSGSMAFDFMPGANSSSEVPKTSPVQIQLQAYTRNTLYYNPNINYQPWRKYDSSRAAGGTTYNKVFTSDTALSGSYDLSDDTQTFYVPKPNATDLSNSNQYYRFQMRWVERGSGRNKTTTLQMVRSAYGTSSGSEGEDAAGCSSSKNNWQNCVFTTPVLSDGTQRSADDEMKNFATWYSYYRTRSKMAKAAASEAFGQIGSNIRVGYDSIWNRSRYKIPVGSDSGKFTGDNRETWFERLQGASASGGTPLKGALQRTGKYFEDASASGPWGPGTGGDQLSCRQNFAILTTDGYWNDNNDYTDPVGNADGADGDVITSKDGKTTGQYKAEPPYSDKNGNGKSGNYSDTLADVANYYWKRDLRTNLDNNVPASSADPAFWQHMTTFGLAIGQSGTLNPDTDLVSIKNGSKYWPKPTSDSQETIDDLWHASVNGRGTFAAANDPTKFARALVDALATVAARTGSASNVTANSTSFQSDTFVYQASYVSGKWTGELAAYAASSAGVAATATWKASAGIPTSKREVYTKGSTSKPVVFPTDDQVGKLGRTGGLAPIGGADNAAYIVGNQTKESQNGGVLRDRVQTVLGDIVDSSPMYVKDNQTIFVGANDGMLHAVNALTGAEEFAYVPAGLNLTDLASLSDPQYVHRWFVDGPVVVSTRVQTPSKNYLIASLGRGGKGVFGMDVTNPAGFDDTSGVVWDKTWSGTTAPAGFDNMGQVLGEPLIVKLNNGTNAALVPNGYNSTTGTASLFVIDLTDGSIIKEIDTLATGGNGLSAPRGWDNDGNGTVDYVYAGDLLGNLWKFDFSGATKGTWKVANGGAAMFVARDAAGTRQAITAGLALAKDPVTSKRWVFIGTGSFMTNADVTDMSTQSMYGVIDDDTVVTGRTSANDGDLAKRSIKLINGTGTQRGFEPNAPLTAGKKGWYIDLLKPPSTQEGERIVSRPQVRGTVLITASLIPPTNDTCSAGGRGYINALDAFSGTSLSQGYFDADGDGDFDDKIGTGDNQVPVGSIDLGVGMPTLPTIIDNLLVVGGSTGTMGSIKINPQSAGARRLTWREILRDQ